MVAPNLNKGLVPRGQTFHHGHRDNEFALEKAILLERLLGDVGSPLSLLKYQDQLQILDTGDRNEARVTADKLSVGGIGFRDIDITADITNPVGANGLDVGSPTVNTSYHFFVIASTPIENISTLAGLFSLSATAPAIPLDFSFFRRVGWRRRNAAAQFYRSSNAPDSNLFTWNEDTTATDFRVLNVATSALAFADVVASPVAPSTCRRIKVAGQIISVPNNLLNLYLRENGLSNAGQVPWLSVGNVMNGKRHGFVTLDASQIFEYHTDNTLHDVIIDVIAYEDIR
ncbi:hypothetical protein LCGC14_0450810 [marine sediment metagenome]|uniref:Uncharacterized protein n=1 Tax=marine sediment metagenome TaxID=412755 RepID=A0A0F9SHP3_9ZZZZ